MKLADAMAGVTRLGFDTAPIIYFVERNPLFIDIVREVFRMVDVGQVLGYAGAVSLTEVLVQPIQVGDLALIAAFENALLHGRNFSLVSTGAAVAERAADLRAQYNLKTPDALQVAAALHAGCQAIVTNDDRHLTRVQELRVLVVKDLEL